MNSCITTTGAFPEMDLYLKHSFTCMVSGPTGSGKTEFVKKLVKNLNNMVFPVPEIIYWCYNEYQPAYVELEGIPTLHFCEGLPDTECLKANKNVPKLIILDDLMGNVKKEDKLTHLFTCGSHHWNISVIHIVQNIFYSGLRTSRVNSHYLVLMKNPSDQLQISTLGHQLFPKNKKYLLEAFHDATAKPHTYLFIDMHQTTPDHLRVRTNIMPGDIQYVYVPK